MDARTKEIRRILTGFITYELDRTVVTVAQNIFQVRGDGFSRGANSARFFGVRVAKRQYMIAGKKKVPIVHEGCINAFAQLGMRAYLYNAPEALAMLYRPILHNPCVVTLEAKENQLLLCVYTARSPLSRLNVKRMLKKLDEVLPAGMTETDVTMTPVSETAEMAEKKRKAKEKAEEKAEKKAEKKIKKAEKKLEKAKEKVDRTRRTKNGDEETQEDEEKSEARAPEAEDTETPPEE